MTRITKTSLAAQVSADTGLPVNDCLRMVTAMVERIEVALAGGRAVDIRDFGSFRIREVRPRGVVTQPSTTVVFIPSAALRARLTSDG